MKWLHDSAKGSKKEPLFLIGIAVQTRCQDTWPDQLEVGSELEGETL
jgi:hypothetical protein